MTGDNYVNTVVVVAAALMMFAMVTLADTARAQRRTCDSYGCMRNTQFCGFRCASRPTWVPAGPRPLPTCDAYRRQRGEC